MIILGPAGSSGLGNIEGMRKCSELKLGAMEVEFTYGVKMSNEDAKKLGELNKKLNIKLSVHGPYYINLASLEKKKIDDSKKRILDSCERAHYFGAKYVIFHAAFYSKKAEEEIYQIVKKEILDLQQTIKKNKWNVVLCPESTGKRSQFGTVDELLKLSKETGCFFCIDFSHILARNNGNINYVELMKKLPQKIQAHFSGIEYSEKGERRHLLVDLNEFKKIKNEAEKQKKEITLICESPDPFGDCIKMQKVL
jgi:deoxyribonuclease-4